MHAETDLLRHEAAAAAPAVEINVSVTTTNCRAPGGWFAAHTESLHGNPYEGQAFRGSDRVPWIDNGDIRRQLRGLPAKHVLVLSDSCFSGSLARSETSYEYISKDRFFTEIDAHVSRKMISSGRHRAGGGLRLRQPRES